MGDGFMRDAQPNVLDFDEVSLKRIVQSLFEDNKFGDLKYACQPIESYEWSEAYLRVLFRTEGFDDELRGLTTVSLWLAQRQETSTCFLRVTEVDVTGLQAF
jgi:hypothetical protein